MYTGNNSTSCAEKEIALLPEVMDCWLMTGSRDYLLRVAVVNLHEFERFLTG